MAGTAAPPAAVSVNVDAVIEAGSSASLNTASTEFPTGTPVTPFPGVFDRTDGGVVSTGVAPSRKITSTQ